MSAQSAKIKHHYNEKSRRLHKVASIHTVRPVFAAEIESNSLSFRSAVTDAPTIETYFQLNNSHKVKKYKTGTIPDEKNLLPDSPRRKQLMSRISCVHNQIFVSISST